jgi:glycosyltransferase involved in cell wall biosynthesis
MRPFRVLAIISAYNEEDVIGSVLGDFTRQGIDVYLIDNHSTDATAREAQPFLDRGLLAIESYPHETARTDGGVTTFPWKSILEHKTELARSLDADWFIHCDADELREGPWDGVSLREAIARVDTCGYNAIDFKVFEFVPTDNSFLKGKDLRKSFPYFRSAAPWDRLQIKAWKRTDENVDLCQSGGHEVCFAGRRVFPIRFILRHYPIRGQKHGERKIFEERIPRFVDNERKQGWHVQYDRVMSGHSFVVDKSALKEFLPDFERTQLLLENRELEALRTEHERLAAHAAILKEDVSWFRSNWPAREKELVETALSLEQTRNALTTLRIKFEHLEDRDSSPTQTGAQRD